jgi:lysophospholipase L1-like esterase
VVVAAIAQGSSAVADWIQGGVHAQRLPVVLKALRSKQLAVDTMVWDQSETEAWTGGDAATYAANLRRWIASVRALGINAPIYVCLTSRDDQGVINPAIRQAQASVWNSQGRVYAGPETDSLGDAFRSDGVHFNERGLEAFAAGLEITVCRSGSPLSSACGASPSAMTTSPHPVRLPALDGLMAIAMVLV